MYHLGIYPLNITVASLLLCLFVLSVPGRAEPPLKFSPQPEKSVDGERPASTTPEAARVMSAVRAYFGKYFSDTYFPEIYSVDLHADLNALLPDWRFFRLRGAISSRGSSEMHSTALVILNVGLSSTGAVVLPGDGEKTEFGEFLKAQRVPARTDSQRASIRNVYRALYNHEVDLADAEPPPPVAGSQRLKGPIRLVLEVDAEEIVSGTKLHSFEK